MTVSINIVEVPPSAERRYSSDVTITLVGDRAGVIQRLQAYAVDHRPEIRAAAEAKLAEFNG